MPQSSSTGEAMPRSRTTTLTPTTVSCVLAVLGWAMVCRTCAADQPSGAQQAPGHPQAVTVVFQKHHRGYTGTRDTFVARHVPDHSIGTKDDMMVGRFGDGRLHRFKGLIKFNNLNLPRHCRVLSAKLTLRCHISGRPKVAVYGLLQDFAEGAAVWGRAKPGETTWNHLRYGNQPWGAPGAGKASDSFTYDGDADHHAPADDTVTLDRDGWHTWDVTASFRSQLEKGKEHGWLLDEVSGAEDTHVSVRSSEAPIYEDPLAPYPRLTVTYVPPPGEAAPPAPSPPKLISFSLGTPQRLMEHEERLGRLPFSGAVFDVEDNRHLSASGEGKLNISVFGPRRLRAEDYSDFIRDARLVFAPHSPLTDNFIRVSTVPGTLTPKKQPYTWENRPRAPDMITMWFGDFDVVVDNFKVAAQVAHRSGSKGILFDWEEYGGDVFNYAQLADAKKLGKSADETARQVRSCAERISRAVSGEYPGVTWIIIYSIYDEKWSALEAAFMDGLIGGAHERTRFVDGHEKYHLSSAAEFRRVYRDTYEKSPGLSAVPDKFLRHLQVGFGVWFDRSGWGPDIEWRYSPARWQTKLENALVVSDCYVWIYTGGAPNWLTGGNLPQPYVDATWQALRNARRLKNMDCK